MCINHWAASSNFKGFTFNKICNGLTGKCFETPNTSYTQRPRYAKLLLNPCQHTAFAAHRVKTFTNKGYTQFGQVYSVFQKHVNKFTIFKIQNLTAHNVDVVCNKSNQKIRYENQVKNSTNLFYWVNNLTDCLQSDE